MASQELVEVVKSLQLQKIVQENLMRVIDNTVNAAKK